MNKLLSEKMKIIPKKPGCYLWKNKNNEIIYVGKAKNLFNRTHQYFDKTHNLKTTLLVNEIFDIDYIIVNNANEALILENNLIKKHWPKYNILLKDSTFYPYIVLTDSIEPKLIYTRKYNKVKGKYYGPLADNKFNAYELFKFLNEISPYDKNGPLKNQLSVFLKMFLQKNNYSSINEINKNELSNQWKKCVDDLFNGRNSDLMNFLIDLENKSVERLDFEHAEKYKNLQICIDNLKQSQIVEFIQNKHADYFCYYQENEYIVFNVFNYINGILISKYNSIHQIYDDFDDVIVNVVIQYYSNNPLPNFVIVSINNELLNLLNDYFKIKFINPISKVDQEIMMIGIKNAQSYLKNNVLTEKRNYDYTIGALIELAQLLKLSKISVIEAFDNSNINLNHSVSGMVVFKNGIPSKKDYRKFNLSTIENSSDFHYMREVIYRRYKYLQDKNLNFPDLIILDGGKLQVTAAIQSLKELNLDQKLNLIGLKKDNHHKTESIILKNGDEIKLDKRSNIFMLLCNIQNEVHNYAISFYRSKHIKSMLNSFLDDIKGIGEKSKNKLLSVYSDIDKIKTLSKDELMQILPEKKVDIILNYINKSISN